MSALEVVDVVLTNGIGATTLVLAVSAWRRTSASSRTVQIRMTVAGQSELTSITLSGGSLDGELAALRTLLGEDSQVRELARPSRTGDFVTRLLALGLPNADMEQWCAMWREDLYYDRLEGRPLHQRAGTIARIALRVPQLMWTLHIERRRAVE